MKINKILSAILLIQGSGLLLPCLASAQAVTAAATTEEVKQEEAEEGGGLNLEEIIVTGTAGGAQVTKFEASFGITTLN